MNRFATYATVNRMSEQNLNKNYFEYTINSQYSITLSTNCESTKWIVFIKKVTYKHVNSFSNIVS